MKVAHLIFLFLTLLLVNAPLEARKSYKGGTKVVTVKEARWEWTNVPLYTNNDSDLITLDKLSANKNVRNIQIGATHIYYQLRTYYNVTKTVKLDGDANYLIKEVFYNRLGGEDHNTGNVGGYSVSFVRDWALVETSGPANFHYFYKFENGDWVEKNEPMNGDYHCDECKGVPTFDDFLKAGWYGWRKS